MHVVPENFHHKWVFQTREPDVTVPLLLTWLQHLKWSNHSIAGHGIRCWVTFIFVGIGIAFWAQSQLKLDQLNSANLLSEFWSLFCSDILDGGKQRLQQRRFLRMIICKRPAHPDDHLQMVNPSGWSFARGLSLRMIICKGPVPSDDRFKRPAPPDDHMQEAGPSGSSFAGGWSLWMILWSFSKVRT